MIGFKPLEEFTFDDCVKSIKRYESEGIPVDSGLQARYNELLLSLQSQELSDYKKAKTLKDLKNFIQKYKSIYGANNYQSQFTKQAQNKIKAIMASRHKRIRNLIKIVIILTVLILCILALKRIFPEKVDDAEHNERIEIDSVIERAEEVQEIENNTNPEVLGSFVSDNGNISYKYANEIDKLGKLELCFYYDIQKDRNGEYFIVIKIIKDINNIVLESRYRSVDGSTVNEGYECFTYDKHEFKEWKNVCSLYVCISRNADGSNPICSKIYPIDDRFVHDSNEKRAVSDTCPTKNKSSTKSDRGRSQLK